jgi:hypothetical protein
MSLLVSGPETLVVYPSKWGTDPSGNGMWLPWETGDPTFTITGVQVEPQGSAPGQANSDSGGINGQIIEEGQVCIFKTLPPGAKLRWDRVRWDGRDWYTDAAPQNFNRSPRTSHWIVRILEVGKS